jgi:hypothetical protein
MNRYPRMQVYDAETDVQVKSLAITGIRATGWVQIEGLTPAHMRQNGRTTMEFDCILKSNDNDSFKKMVTIAPVHIDKISTGIKVMSFDFEVYSSVKDTFPDATRLADCIFQISMIFKTINGPIKRYICQR